MTIPRNRTARIIRAALGRLCRYKLGRRLVAPKGEHLVRVGDLDSTALPYWEQYLRLPPGMARLPGPGSHLSVAVGAERIVGHVSIHRQWEHTELCIPGWWLTGLEVDPVWRGRGIGNRLVERVIKSWEANNVEEPLYLLVKATNKPAVSLFEGAGFVRLESTEWARILRKVYHETRKGQWAYQIMKRSPAA